MIPYRKRCFLCVRMWIFPSTVNHVVFGCPRHDAARRAVNLHFDFDDRAGRTRVLLRFLATTGATVRNKLREAASTQVPPATVRRSNRRYIMPLFHSVQVLPSPRSAASTPRTSQPMQHHLSCSRFSPILSVHQHAMFKSGRTESGSDRDKWNERRDYVQCNEVRNWATWIPVETQM